MKSLEHPSFLSNFQDHLMKLILTIVLVLSTLSFPSFGESSNIRYLETKRFKSTMLVRRMCIGGYEFALICTRVGADACNAQKDYNFALEQIISSEGGGVSC